MKVGYYTEIVLPEYNVHFLAINDGVDSERMESADFTPFRNIINELYAKDTSKKVRASMKSRALQGQHLTGMPPYGYKVSPHDKKKWIIDEPAAEVVKEIFRLYIEGLNFNQIALELDKRGVEVPSEHMRKHGVYSNGDRCIKVENPPKLWHLTVVIVIIDRYEYAGHMVSGRQTTRSYKDRRTVNIPKDEWIVTKNTHPPIVDEETWQTAQRIRENGRRRKVKTYDKGALNGLLYCQDCGARLYFKGSSNTEKYKGYYMCGYYSHYRLCTIHSISRKNIEELVLVDIKRVTAFAKEKEAEFVKMVEQNHRRTEADVLHKNKKELAEVENRVSEIDRMINELYEDKVRGDLDAVRFSKMLSTYEDEHKTLTSKGNELRSAIAEEIDKSNCAEKFLELVKRYTQFEELTTEIATMFIEKVIVGQAEKVDGVKQQEIRIIYNLIGETASVKINNSNGSIKNMKKK